MTKKKYMISHAEMQAFTLATGMDIKLLDRRTGKSTALALRYIADAIENPSKPIKIIDHTDIHTANVLLFNNIVTMLNDLNLQYIEFNNKNLTITFNLYEPEPLTKKQKYEKKFNNKIDRILK